MSIQASPDALVLRTEVSAESSYSNYLPNLRLDFFYACSYCFMAESEAHGISFEIDHYLPKKVRSDLIAQYSNLMYSCKICNRFKSSRYCPEHDKQDGERFFKADIDFFGDHYEINGILIEAKTQVAKYTIEYVYLNRKSLRKLRELRRRLADCDECAAIGMLWLQRFHIDRLPQSLRLQGKDMIEEALSTGEKITTSDELVRRLNRSELLGLDDEDKRERKRRLKLLRDRMLV